VLPSSRPPPRKGRLDRAGRMRSLSCVSSTFRPFLFSHLPVKLSPWRGSRFPSPSLTIPSRDFELFFFFAIFDFLETLAHRLPVTRSLVSRNGGASAAAFLFFFGPRLLPFLPFPARFFPVSLFLVRCFSLLVLTNRMSPRIRCSDFVPPPALLPPCALGLALRSSGFSASSLPVVLFLWPVCLRTSQPLLDGDLPFC